MKHFKSIIAVLFLIAAHLTFGQNDYTIDVNVPEKGIQTGHLDLGGVNPKGENIAVNSFFITQNGKPIIPVLGEFHYSRYPSKYWDEAIKKMKAGGISIIATYVFWNLHERTQGVFDWTKNLNLRHFAELCAQNDIYLIVRMGPFDHGEMRNGGIPDWMYGRSFEIRSNDPEYLKYADRLYSEISKQCEGLLYKNGGPIIGVQLENEFQHSAAPWEITYPGARKEYTVAEKNQGVTHEQISDTDGDNPFAEDGMNHMITLKKMALKHGMDVPLFTATGWGNAAIVPKGSLPVTAAYAYPFWAPPSPSPFYLFKNIHKFPDYSPVSYDAERYPSIAAEIGPGIQIKYSRRPKVDPKSVLPLMVRTIGSGSNGIGYYMYHGGSTPVFDGKFYNENVNGLPKINYDFQAPIGQYGQTRLHYYTLRTLHMFLESFGEQLAPMQTVLPKSNAHLTPEDITTLRYAVRSKDDQGFVFMINFQDHLEYNDMKDVSITVKTSQESLRFPQQGNFDLKKNTSAIFPFNLNLGATKIKSATVQPLTILHSEEKKYYVFQSFEGIPSEFVIEKGTKLRDIENTVIKESQNNSVVKSKQSGIFSFKSGGDYFLVLPHETALNTVKIGDRLIISDGLVTELLSGQLNLICRNTNAKIHFFPGLKNSVKTKGAHLKKINPLLKGVTSYSLTFDKPDPVVQVKKVTNRKYAVTMNGDLKQLNNIYLKTDYIGDRGMAFIDGLLVTDHFYQEKQWEIGLKEFLPELKKQKEMVLIFYPLYDDQEALIDFDNLPEFKDGKFLKVNQIKVVNEYKAKITF